MRHYRWASRLGRRQALGAGGVTLAASLLAACGGGGTKTESPASAPATTSSGVTSAASTAGGTPKPGGTLQYGIDNLQDVMDPHQTTRVTYALVWHNISHHLIGIDLKTGGFSDTEATKSMEQPDPTTLVFKLWPGISWQQTADIAARPFTAADVAFNLKRIATNEPRFPRRSQFSEIDSVSTPDTGTVVVKMKQPYAPFLYYLGSGYNVLVNPDATEKFGGVIDRVSAASGIGPFTLESLDKAAGAKLKRNTAYFQKGLPYLDAVEIIGFTDDETSLASFRTGQLHVFGLPLTAEDEIKASVKGVQVLATGSPGQYVGPGLSFKAQPFDDMRVRQAVSLAIDRHAMMAQAYQGKGAHLLAPAPWGLGDFAIPEAELATMPGYRKDKTADFQQARQLLSAAGLKPEDVRAQTTVGNLSYYPPTYETVLPQLRQFGFRLDVQVQDNTAFRNAQSKGEYVWQWNLSLVDAEPDAVLRLFNYTKASRNYNGFSDPEVDQLIDKQARELDRKTRTEITREISKRLIERPNWILTANLEARVAAQAAVRDLRVAPAGSTDARDLTRTWLEK
ncbi:MAG: ABC transporter substrate-binding protein [Dehalococcoidia bacterium]